MAEVTPDELAKVIAEGFHTGLRRGTNAEDSHELWAAIGQSQTSAWMDAARFCARSLQSMGYTVTRPDPKPDPFAGTGHDR